MACLYLPLYIVAPRSKREKEYRLSAIKDGRELQGNGKYLHDFEHKIEKLFKKNDLTSHCHVSTVILLFWCSVIQYTG